MQQSIVDMTLRMVHLEESNRSLREAQALISVNQEKDDEEISLLQIFPIKTNNNLLALEEKIKNSISLKKKCIKLAISVGGRDEKQLAINTMKRFMTDELAQHFSYTGKKGFLEKKTFSFSEKELCKVVHEAVRKSFPNSTDENIKKHIMNFLNQAKTRLSRRDNDKAEGEMSQDA